nr:ATP-binding protein [Propionivibrio soli]
MLTLVSVSSVLILCVAATLSYRQARHDVQELMDSQIAGTARLMLAQVQHGPEHLADLPNLIANQRGLAAHSRLALEYTIADASGKALVRSSEAPELSRKGKLGFSTSNAGGIGWRNVVLETSDGTHRIQVSQSLRARDKEAFEIAKKTVTPLGLFFPVFLLAIYVSVRRGLKPLDDLAADVSQRTPENLAPLANATAPREAQPLVAALNRLLFRLAGSLENERRFTSDAAHELRTPLAAVRIQTQVALLSEDAEKRRHALTQTLKGIDRATRVVEQMLRLARLEPLAGITHAQPVDLAELAREVAAAVLDSAPDSVIALSVDEETPTIDGDAELLGVALRNLIDNAVRYSPPASTVAVSLRCKDGDIRLSVCDRGPGVADDELPRLVERFYRGPAVSAEGSGLGLTIVQRIAELHGATLELANREGGGLDATLRWPARRSGGALDPRASAASATIAG